MTHCITNCIQFPSKPNLCIIFYRKSHFIRSYALLKSSFNAIYPTPSSFLLWTKWTNSLAIKMLSVINLLGTNALWNGDIMVGRITFNLFTIALEHILKINIRQGNRLQVNLFIHITNNDTEVLYCSSVSGNPFV